MAAKVFLISADQRKTDKVKRSRAESLVRQLLAFKVSAFVYQMVRVRSAHEQTSNHTPAYIPWGLEPFIDPLLGVKEQVPILANQVRFRAF